MPEGSPRRSRRVAGLSSGVEFSKTAHDDHPDAREEEFPHSKPKSELGAVLLLLVLYTLQGLPMGLSAAVRLQLKQIFVGGFSEVGTFALASWPFSLKVWP